MSTIDHFKKTASMSVKNAKSASTSSMSTKKTKHNKPDRVIENKKGKSSISKKHWEKLLNDPTSKSLLKKVWNSKNPQQNYKDTIKKIASKVK